MEEAARGTVQSQRLPLVPRMLDALGHALLGGSERRPIRFEEIRRTAERKVGTSDWGATAELDRATELLEKDLNDYPARFLGRFATVDQFTRHHVNRLRMRKAVAEASPAPRLKHPPYIIVGLYRCGTTLLHNLLSAVPGRGYVPFWELMHPTPVPGRERDAKRTVRTVRSLSPEHHVVHPTFWDGPEECWLLRSSSLRAPSFPIVLDIPSYTAWLDELDNLEAYYEYRVALEWLSQSRDTALVMKGPSHTHDLEALHRAIPEARIVYIHRDPAKAVASYCSLSALHHRTFYGWFDPEAVGDKIVDRFAHFTRRAMEQRPRVDDESIVDVYFHDLVDDPIGLVRRVGEHFGDPWSDEAEQAVQAKLDGMPRNKYGKHDYSAAQWGLTAEGIRERFADYLQAHEVRRESC